MIPATVAHVLRLEHLTRTAVTLIETAARAKVTISAIPSRQRPNHATITLPIVCGLCGGSRQCPDCGEPCEVCTVVAGGTGLVS